MHRFFCIFFLFHLSLPVWGQIPVTAYPDNSPLTEDFVLMGLTEPNRPWTDADYRKAVDLLDRIYEADKFSLPRKGSAYSGKIYDRMFNPENFNFLISENGNLGNQIIGYERIKGIGYRLLIYYIEDTEPTERFGAEVLDCLLLDGWLTMQGILLYDALAGQLTQEQLAQSNLRRGFQETAKEYKRSLEEIFYVLEGDYMRYDVRVLEEYAQRFGAFVEQLPDRTSSTEYRRRLAHLAKKFPDKNIRRILQEYVS